MKTKPITIGKLRGLQRCTSSLGTFNCLALDHRQNLRRSLNPDNPSTVTDHDLSQFKLEVTKALADLGTAVLLDPEYSAAQAIGVYSIPKKTGLVVAVESTGYSGEATARRAKILPGWSVEKAKRMGADAIKLLVYYHPDSSMAGEIEDFVQEVAGDCLKLDLAIMLEPLSYSLDPIIKTISSDEKRYVVIETARRLTPLGVDVLKVEFPADVHNRDETYWQDACREITTVSAVPWILLSAAVDFETYLQQVTVACKAGASGIAVGRAVWMEAVQLAGDDRKEFLNTTGRGRLKQLNAICEGLATPVNAYYECEPGFDWYKTY